MTKELWRLVYGLVLAETDTYGGVSDLADEGICEWGGVIKKKSK